MPQQIAHRPGTPTPLAAAAADSSSIDALSPDRSLPLRLNSRGIIVSQSEVADEELLPQGTSAALPVRRERRNSSDSMGKFRPRMNSVSEAAEPSALEVQQEITVQEQNGMPEPQQGQQPEENEQATGE